MANLETKFIDRVNDRLPLIGRAGSRAALPHFAEPVFYERIVMPHKGGVPDCWYGGVKRDAWVEYKWIAKPPQKGVCAARYLTPAQRDWLTLHSRDRHRLCLVVLGSPSGVLTVYPGDFDTLFSAETVQWLKEDGTDWVQALSGNFLALPDFVTRFYALLNRGD
jgi:hypothetical protein